MAKKMLIATLSLPGVPEEPAEPAQPEVDRVQEPAEGEQGHRALQNCREHLPADGTERGEQLAEFWLGPGHGAQLATVPAEREEQPEGRTGGAGEEDALQQNTAGYTGGCQGEHGSEHRNVGQHGRMWHWREQGGAWGGWGGQWTEQCVGGGEAVPPHPHSAVQH